MKRFADKTCAAAILAGVSCILLMLSVLAVSVYAQPQQKRKGGEFFGIMYHQVLKDEKMHGAYVISPEELESDLRFFKENGFVSLLPSELSEYRKNGWELPEKTVVISFDDGYETGLYYVLPLLKKYGMKAAINIVGEYTDKYSGLSENEKNLSYAYLTWDEVRALANSGLVEIGNHTDSLHSTDSALGCAMKYGESIEDYHDRLFADITALQGKMSDHTGIKPVSFAFPFGSISDGAEDIILETGIDVLFTCRELPSSIGDGYTVVNRYNRSHGRSAEKIYSLYLEKCGVL